MANYILGDKLSENMTLADVGVQDGSCSSLRDKLYMHVGHGVIERPRDPPRIPENDYRYYADAFKSGWREEHAKALLHLLLELCQDGTISEGNVTDEAWLRIQNTLKNSIQCSFEIDFLKQRLSDYKQLYSVLAETTTTSIFKWDRERKTITIKQSEWRVQYPELILLCGPYIPYFDTLEEVCLLLNTRLSSEQNDSETSTNINNAWEGIRSMDSRAAFAIRCTCPGTRPGYCPYTNPHTSYSSQPHRPYCPSQPRPDSQFPGSHTPSPNTIGYVPQQFRPSFSGPHAPQCQICLKLGHTAKNCYDRFSQDREQPVAAQYPSTFHTNMAQLTETFDEASKLILDSGTTNHVTSDIHNEWNASSSRGGTYFPPPSNSNF